MPIYEYQCQACDFEFEKLRKISDPALTDCPECNAASVTKKISAAGFRLSGSGWYETDFKSGAKKNLTADPGAPDKNKKTEPSAAPKTDAKASKPSSASPSNDK